MPELLRRVVQALKSNGINHMVVGSFASSFHGEPRATRDIDLVIDPDTDAMAALLDELSDSSTYVGDGMRALRERSMFNVIDTSSGWKTDLILRKDREFSRVEFERRELVRLDGTETWVASAEDTVLAKLEWMQMSGSEQQQRDVIDIIETVGKDLDRNYLAQWAEVLGLTAVWEQVEAAALD